MSERNLARDLARRLDQQMTLVKHFAGYRIMKRGGSREAQQHAGDQALAYLLAGHSGARAIYLGIADGIALDVRHKPETTCKNQNKRTAGGPIGTHSTPPGHGCN